MTRLQRPEILLGICALVLLALTGYGLTVPQPVPGRFGIGYGHALNVFVGLTGVQAVVYFAAMYLVLRAAPCPSVFWIVIGAAILLRLTVVAHAPFLSNDMYRYIWDGRVQAAGINPYFYVPADPHLVFLRDSVVYPNVSRAHYAHTIYPPAAEMVFFAAVKGIALLHMPPALGMKLLLTGFEGVGIWAMVHLLDFAGMPRARVAIYAWNPLPVWEYAGNGHVDAIAICLISLALLAACRARSGWSAVALAAATLVKFYPAVLLPAIWRRWDWVFLLIFSALIVCLYLPYLGAGTGVFGFLGGYGAEEGIDSGRGIFLLSALGKILPLPEHASVFYLGGLAGILLILGLRMIFGPALPPAPQARSKIICERAMLLGGVMLAGLSPHYPWYYAWVLIPAIIAPKKSVLYLVSFCFLLYLNPGHKQLFWPAFVFGPFLALALYDALGAGKFLPRLRLQTAKGEQR